MTQSEKEKVIKDELGRELANTDTQVHTFEAEASSEEKAKQMLEASLDTANTDDHKKTTGKTTPLPGSIPSAVAETFDIPEWARTGWQRIANLTTDADKDLFDDVLGDMYYGKLWLNVAIVFISVFITYVITSLGGGIGWVIIISAFVGTYFKSSVQRFYRNARSEISNELAKEKLELYEESAEWINEFLRRFWLIYEPVLSATIAQTANSTLAASKPSFLDSIRLTTFTLGSKPVIIESIRSYPKSDDDVVVMDWRISYIPNDLVNMTRAQISNRVNPKIVLTIRVGKGKVGAGIPVLLEDISFSGLIRVKLKLINTFPHIKTIDISFLEEPKLDYVLKPVGGEFGFEVANLPGLSSFILDQAHATLRPMMYAPNIYTLDAELLIGSYPIETAIGVLKITIFSAKGLRNAEKFGTSDPYIRLKVHGNKELAKTKVIEDSLNPIWNETHFLILTTLNEFLRLELWDFNGLSKDKPLGTSSFELKPLSTDPKQEDIKTPVLYEGKPYGEIKFDAAWYPVAEGKDGGPAPESQIGIIRLNIHQAKDLGQRRNSYAELLLNGKVVYKTKTLKRTNHPAWEEPTEIFIANRAGSKLTINIRDERDLVNDPIVGKWESTLEKFLEDSKKKDWFDITEALTGKLRLTCLWKPVLMDDIPGPSGYVEPCGFVRLEIKSAKELKNLAQIGKSDPYVKILLDSTVRGRTDVVSDNLNPVWNEVFYIPVHSTRETLNIQVWDREVNAKDKRIGFTELELSKLIRKREDGTIEAAENIDESSDLLFGNETKGSVNYSAAFHPVIKGNTISVDNIKEITKDNQSGILVTYINKAKLEKRDTSVDIYVDNGLYPVYSTNRCKSANPEYDEVTDVFVKEFDFAKIIFQIKHGDNKNPIGVVENDVNELLEKCLKSSKEEGVEIPINGINNATLNVYVHFIPVKYTLLPSESINNMGDLQITIKNAENLPAADRSGTSDPYIVFILNSDKVYKTKTVKKNCNPEYNEDFSVKVLSRETDVLKVEIFDWNQIGSAKKIATGTIQLGDLPTFERAVKKIQLKNELKSSEPGGALNLHIVFRPSLVIRKRQSTGGIVSGATRALSGIGTGVGSIVSSGGSFVGLGTNNVVSGANNVVSGAGNAGFGFLKKKK